MQLGATSISPISHRLPANPGGQLQLKPLILSVQVPLFKQGLLSHSFISETNNNHRCDCKQKQKKQKSTFAEGSLIVLKVAKESYTCK